MNEMDYKEKIIALLESQELTQEQKEKLEEIFPELKGSEDEKIRQWIVDELKDSLHSIQSLYSGDYDHRDEQDKVREDYLKRSIAWLEKQGKDGKVWFYRDDYVRDKKQAYQDGIDNVLNNPQKYGLEKQSEQPKKHDVCDNCDQQGSCVSPCPMKLVEKQGEQILVNSAKTCKDEKTILVIPKFRVGDVIRHKGSTAEYTIESISGECYHGKGWGLHISCDNDYELVEQKTAEWSEEDKGMLLEVKCLVDNLHSDGGNANYNTEELQEMWNWLDTIWQRVKYPQPKQEWSEEDEKSYYFIIEDYVERLDATPPDELAYRYSKAVDFLKSLRFQSHWKPTEAQIWILEYVTDRIPDKTYLGTMKGLINDLKKL